MRASAFALIAASLLTTPLANTAFAKASKREKKAPPPPPASTSEVKPVMGQFLANLQALQPFMTSEKAFSAPENEAAIGARLNSLAKGAESLDHFSALKAPGFAISVGVLQDNVRQTNAAFQRGRTEYARWMLNETLQSCISCHSQLPSGASSFVIPPDTVKGSPLERADFLFATRQFDEALKLYDQILSEYHPDQPSGGMIPVEPAEGALKHELAIFLRVRRDPEAAATALDRQLENGALPSSLRESMRQWANALRKPGLVPTFNPKTVPLPELTAYVNSVLGEETRGTSLFTSPAKAANYLLLSGVLYEALQATRPGMPQSQLLYWLAKSDRGLSTEFYFSMSDLYLQECVRRAPRTPIAKKCFRDFEETVTLQYTGSRGTDLPDDVQELLSDLRNLTR